MKRVLYSNMTATAKQPFLQATHKQYNDAIYEGFKSVMTNLTDGDNSNYYLLHGCVITGTYPNVSVSAGAVYYNGEIYQTAAASLTTPANISQIGGIITTTYDAVDPVLFSDNSTHNVHQTKTIVWGDISVITEDFLFQNLKRTPVQQMGDVMTYTTLNPTDLVPTGGGTVDGTSVLELGYKRVGNRIFGHIRGELQITGTVTAITIDTTLAGFPSLSTKQHTYLMRDYKFVSTGCVNAIFPIVTNVLLLSYIRDATTNRDHFYNDIQFSTDFSFEI